MHKVAISPAVVARVKARSGKLHPFDVIDPRRTALLVIDVQNCFLPGGSLAVKEGEVVCLLGRNGAGKTTTILTIMGYLKPRPGRILYRGRDIAALPPYAVARLGFGFVPQERGIFPSLTVRENLTVFARACRQPLDP